MKPNESRTCTACISCVLNKTALVQTGSGRKLKCPICDTEYDPDYEVKDEFEVDEEIHAIYESWGWLI